MKKILVTGNFDILHPGHIRLLKFAKECGDHLIVGVQSDDTSESQLNVDESHRLEMVKAIEFIDDSFIMSEKIDSLINSIKPYAVVKGKEFENANNPECSALNAYGGKLIFGSGELKPLSKSHLQRKTANHFHFDYHSLQQYIDRRKIHKQDLNKIIHAFENTNVAVIGEIIVDEYIDGAAVGLSSEDPTIVLSPNERNVFLGGAAITAGHFKALGANHVYLLSVIGNDAHATTAKNIVKNYQLHSFIHEDPSRPTLLKTRYRADNKTLLRVNIVRHHEISRELQEKLFNNLISIIKKINVLVFSDFNYGLLPQALVDKISRLCIENHVLMVADSQTSSQMGDVSRYQNMMLLTPTERECRVSLNDYNSGLVSLSRKLCQKSSPKNLVITLGAEGSFIHMQKNDHEWENDQLPAINTHPKDPAGAGDCYLATSTLCLLNGASNWQAFFTATLASACQTARMGNVPLQKSTLTHVLDECFI